MKIKKIKKEDLLNNNEFLVVTRKELGGLAIEVDGEQINCYLDETIEVISKNFKDKELFDCFIYDNFLMIRDIFKDEIQNTLDDLSISFGEENSTLEEIKDCFYKFGGNNFEKKLFWLMWRRVVYYVKVLFEEYKKEMDL